MSLYKSKMNLNKYQWNYTNLGGSQYGNANVKIWTNDDAEFNNFKQILINWWNGKVKFYIKKQDSTTLVEVFNVRLVTDGQTNIIENPDNWRNLNKTQLKLEFNTWSGFISVDNINNNRMYITYQG